MTDFWWLSPSEKAIYTYVELSHHEPMRDDDQPCSIHWDQKVCMIDDINSWRSRFQNTNVYRSLKVAGAPSGGQELLGPLLVDIDSENEDLEDALVVTREAIEHLEDSHGVKTDDLRIFFTGRKGFNLEVCPKALQIQGSIADQIKRSADELDHLIEGLRHGNTWQTSNQVSAGGTVIDRVYGSRCFGYGLRHPYIRLHCSLNKWISSGGTVTSRMKIEINVDELDRLTTAGIVARSEGFAK